MSEEIAAILSAHLDLMRSSSPACSVHALDLDKLRQPDITFWAAWIDGGRVGCVAMKEIDPTHGEIKSMHTLQALRGQGIAEALLAHLEDEAKSRGYSRISLETGRPEPFHAAHRLYRRFGYTECPPFGDYTEDPFSMCMTKEI